MGDDIQRRDVDEKTVTNVFSAEVNHGLVIQAGSFEGDLHVHTPPERSAEQESAMAEMWQRLAAQEDARREAEWRRERERQRRRRSQDIASALHAQEERVRPVRVVVHVVTTVLMLVLLMFGNFSAVSFAGVALCIAGAAVARFAPTSFLEKFLGKG
ncbi:hypothetical protein [Streptomyces monomycini]|uniref:hypothetical protein n=1 Tax=Streptomyces monomycini TaxID=371720 RepID=UPI0004AAAC14|nr:hypothetical protein [Streptomyces monomycini]